MNSFIIDYLIHGSGFASPETRKIFSEEIRLQRWLDVEVALAKCQAKLGLIPDWAADEIEAKAKIENFDFEKLSSETSRTKHSLVPLLNQLESMVSEKASCYIHVGATTQDIQDTAQALELKEVIELMCDVLRNGIQILIPKAREHTNTVMPGRTHSMPASPITFGLKLANWIDELVRNIERLEQAKERICVAQLSGSVGTSAGFGPQGPELLKLFANHLSLAVPNISWHVSRDRIAEFTFLLSMASSIFARAADELRCLNRPEIGEIEVAWKSGEIGSSCMPQKRNPEDCEQIVTLARLTRAQVPLSLEAMILEHERDYRGMRLEWPLIMSVSHYAISAGKIFNELVSRMRINSQRMEKNSFDYRHHICVENLMVSLTTKIGRTRAYELAYVVTQDAISKNLNIVDAVSRDPEICAALTQEEIVDIFNPKNFTGSSTYHINQVLSAAERVLNRRSTVKIAA
jgi:adenylosuccinate lyase